MAVGPEGRPHETKRLGRIAVKVGEERPRVVDERSPLGERVQRTVLESKDSVRSAGRQSPAKCDVPLWVRMRALCWHGGREDSVRDTAGGLERNLKTNTSWRTDRSEGGDEIGQESAYLHQRPECPLPVAVMSRASRVAAINAL